MILPRPIVLTALLAIANASAGSTPPVERIRERVEPFVEANVFHGVIAWSTRESPVQALAFGRADHELDVDHRTGNIFRIASVSKQFTAAAILLLQEDGRLQLDDTIDEHLPGFGHGARITIEQLLRHRSGLIDVYALPSFGRTAGRHGDVDAVVEEIGSHELAFEPGSDFAYSNGGYVVLAAIVEAASGLEFGRFLSDRIFGPLGMDDTAHDGPGPVVAGRVSGYDPWGPIGLSRAAVIHPAFVRGAGSLWSSACDLLTWTRSLGTGTLLSTDSLAAMTRDGGDSYGLGVSVFTRFGRRAVGHDGRIDGFASDLCWYQDDGVTVVVLSNVQSVVRDRIRVAVAAELFGEQHEPDSLPNLRRARVDELSGLPGTYEFGPGFAVHVTVADGRLLARANQGADTELLRTDDGQWYSRVLDTPLRFERDAGTRAIRIEWGPRGRAAVGARVEGP